MHEALFARPQPMVQPTPAAPASSPIPAATTEQPQIGGPGAFERGLFGLVDTFKDPRMWGASGLPPEKSRSLIPGRQDPNLAQGSPRTAMDMPQERMPETLPAGMGGPRNFPGKSTVPVQPGAGYGRGLPAVAKTPQGQVMNTSGSSGPMPPMPTSPQTTPAAMTTPAAAPPQQGMTLASYMNQLQNAMGTGDVAAEREKARKDAQAQAMFMAGMGMMAAGSQPGAGLFSSLGQGGLAGMAAYRQRVNDQTRAENDAQQTRLGLFKTAADLYGADATRQATASWRADQAQRDREKLAEDRRYHDIRGRVDSRTATREARTNANAEIANDLKARDQALQESSKLFDPQIDPEKFHEEYRKRYISNVKQYGLMGPKPAPEAQVGLDENDRPFWFVPDPNSPSGWAKVSPTSTRPTS